MKPIELVIVGAGNRGDCYAKLALRKPEKLRIVGLVDPSQVRLDLMREKYGVPEENCFHSLEEFLARDKFADGVINGTMDQLHVQTTVPVLEKGYDVLLEKPFCVNEDELWELKEAADRTGRRVMICHVLRYTPFYSAIKKKILEGEIGEVISIQMAEHVSYHHFGVSYIRGKWANESECGSPIILAKCSHDLDLMMWMNGGKKPVSVASFGSDYQFRPENKPNGAGNHCMIDCPAEVEGECLFSCRKNYLEPELHWQQYVCRELEGGEISYDTVKAWLQNPENNFGRCVWDCKHDVVDHQAVIVNFENGTTGTFTLVGAQPRAERKIHIAGTKGEIKGVFEDSKFVIRKAAPNNTFVETEIDLNVTGDMSGEYGGHGGGDQRLSEDFVDMLMGQQPSISCTALADSLYSHLTAFRAEKARKNKTVEPVF